MDGLLSLIAVAALVVPAAIVALVPRRWLVWAMVGWIVSPIPIYWLLIAVEVARGSTVPDPVRNATFGFFLISSFVAVPWIAACVAAFGVGAAIRWAIWRKRRATRAAEPVAAPIPPRIKLPELDGRRHLDLEALGSHILAIAEQIGASTASLPTLGVSLDGARPHIESDGLCYHWVVVERGQELERRTTRSLDELLYWVFEDVSRLIASNMLASEPARADHYAATLADRQIRILRSIEPRWAERRRRELDRAP